MGRGRDLQGHRFVGPLLPTADPGVWIDEQRAGYVRYVASDGRRWEVVGVCDRRASCLVGAVIDGEVVGTIDRARELAASYSGLDVPVSEGFGGCCPLKVVVLR